MRNFSQLNLNFLDLTLRYRTKPFPNPYFLSKNNCIFSSSSSPVMESAYWELQQSLLESAWKFLQKFCAKAEENNDNRKKWTKKKMYINICIQLRLVYAKMQFSFDFARHFSLYLTITGNENALIQRRAGQDIGRNY